MLDLRRLTPHRTPNYYLLLPEGYGTATPHARSPRFEVPADVLYDAWRNVALAAPRVALLEEDRAACRLAVTQRSAVFRFPDDVTAEVVALGANRATLAVYSRSRLGLGDLGVNGRRVRRWLAALGAALTAQ